MAPWPPLDPPVPLSVLRLRLIRIFVCVVICVIHQGHSDRGSSRSDSQPSSVPTLPHNIILTATFLKCEYKIHTLGLGHRTQTSPASTIDVIWSNAVPYRLPPYSPCSTNLAAITHHNSQHIGCPVNICLYPHILVILAAAKNRLRRNLQFFINNFIFYYEIFRDYSQGLHALNFENNR